MVKSDIREQVNFILYNFTGDNFVLQPHYLSSPDFSFLSCEEFPTRKKSFISLFMLSTFQLIAFFLPSLYLVLHVECGFVEIILSIFYDVYAPATADAATFICTHTIES